MALSAVVCWWCRSRSQWDGDRGRWSEEQGWGGVSGRAVLGVLAHTATGRSGCAARATAIKIPDLAPGRLPALFAGSRPGAHSSPPAGAGGEMSKSVVTGAALAQAGRGRCTCINRAAPEGLDLQAP